MGRKLVELWDPTQEIPEVTEAEVVARVQHACRERLLVAMAVSEFKRRLTTATDTERHRDKQIARAAGGALGSVIMICEGHERSWSSMWEDFREEAKDNLAIRQVAGVLQFADWLPAVAAELESEAVWCAGWVLAYNTQSATVRGIVRQLDNCRDRLLKLAEVV